uniref:Reverse transcriptase zinc-binding domain-containing protein n=1 Tax=Leersia perrieri TaxID=77586 RepID=A0A0D9VXA2_9ORYZ
MCGVHQENVAHLVIACAFAKQGDFLSWWVAARGRILQDQRKLFDGTISSTWLVFVVTKEHQSF